MKIFHSLLLASFMLPFCLWPSGKAHALSLGTNITVYDGSSNSTYQSQSNTMGYTGLGVGNEDQETEPSTLRSEKWDLEAFYLRGTVLSMVGQWDFINGEPGASGSYDSDGDGNYTSGDIFIDIDPTANDGYEYVFDVDWKNKSYDLYAIKNGVLIQATYKMTSDPWKIDSSKSTLRNLLKASAQFTSGTNNNLGFYGSSDHYYVTGFDLAPILTDLGVDSIDFSAHFTMECGNDDLEGSGTAPVPEPATILLMGSGLAILGSLGRKRARAKKA